MESITSDRDDGATFSWPKRCAHPVEAVKEMECESHITGVYDNVIFVFILQVFVNRDICVSLSIWPMRGDTCQQRGRRRLYCFRLRRPSLALRPYGPKLAVVS